MILYAAFFHSDRRVIPDKLQPFLYDSVTFPDFDTLIKERKQNQ